MRGGSRRTSHTPSSFVDGARAMWVGWVTTGQRHTTHTLVRLASHCRIAVCLPAARGPGAPELCHPGYHTPNDDLTCRHDPVQVSSPKLDSGGNHQSRLAMVSSGGGSASERQQTGWGPSISMEPVPLGLDLRCHLFCVCFLLLFIASKSVRSDASIRPGPS
jgi:hypothetical protein